MLCAKENVTQECYRAVSISKDHQLDPRILIREMEDRKKLSATCRTLTDQINEDSCDLVTSKPLPAKRNVRN